MSGKVDFEVRCKHYSKFLHRVTNVRDGDDWRGKNHRSVWVCDAPACTRDAQAWVLRSDEPDTFTYAAEGHKCVMCEPRVAKS